MSNSPTSTVTSEDELIGRVLAGRYRIEALLGAGGMGAVYRAEHVHMRKAVAVKVLHHEMTRMPEVVARFEREAVAAARIEHPNVATAKDFGQLDDGSFYLALEFVEGKSLSRILRDEGRMPEERALHIARQIADALAAAHAANIVHRDLKPDNVMLVQREGMTDMVKVLDFGIAKVKIEHASDQQPLTQVGMVFGTPEYMSPEQAQGFDVDARSDLYTLGLIVYEMLSGTSPFRHEDLVAILARQITMDPPPLPASVSPATSEFVLQLLKKSPAQRPQSAIEVRDRFDALLAELAGRGAAEALPRSGVERKAAAAPPAESAPVVVAGMSVSDAATARTMHALAHTASSRSWAMVVSELRVRALRYSQQIELKRPVRIGRYTLSLGALLGLAGLGVVTLTLLLVLVLLPHGGSSETSHPPPPPSDPDVLLQVAKAEAGDAAALAALAEREPQKRSLIEWRAIGHGLCLSGAWDRGLSAYADGLNAHRELAGDAQLLADVRQAVERPDVSERAIAIAAGPLGPIGADLLYDVWERGRSANSPISQRARALLDQEPVKSQSSPSLRALTVLQATLKKQKCSEIKRVLGEVGNDFDERAVPQLSKLSDRRGCGFLGLLDCYGCLRGPNNELSQALEVARGRAKPSFSPSLPSSAAPANSVR